MGSDDVELERVVIHRSLTRPLLVNGGERVPMLILGLTCVALIFVGLKLATVALAIVLWFAGSAVLKRLAKTDPYMFGIYRRHIQYGGRKLSRATPWGTVRRTRSWSK